MSLPQQPQEPELLLETAREGLHESTPSGSGVNSRVNRKGAEANRRTRAVIFSQHAGVSKEGSSQVTGCGYRCVLDGEEAILS